MFFKDAMEALLAQSENRHAGKLAGDIDLIKWPLEVTTGSIAMGNIIYYAHLLANHLTIGMFGTFIWHIAPIVFFIELGNYFGRRIGTEEGDKFIKETK
jgi:hypothetical protein